MRQLRLICHRKRGSVLQYLARSIQVNDGLITVGEFFLKSYNE